MKKGLGEICKIISERFEIVFIEIGCDLNHVHFLIQSVPMLSVKTIVQTVKSITAKELFRLHPKVKQQLWGGHFWTSGYYVNTVGQFASEETIDTLKLRFGVNSLLDKSLQSSFHSQSYNPF